MVRHPSECVIQHKAARHAKRQPVVWVRYGWCKPVVSVRYACCKLQGGRTVSMSCSGLLDMTFIVCKAQVWSEKVGKHQDSRLRHECHA